VQKSIRCLGLLLQHGCGTMFSSLVLLRILKWSVPLLEHAQVMTGEHTRNVDDELCVVW